MGDASPRIAVTGVGIVSALGASASLTFERLCAGESGISELTLFDTTGLPARLAGEVRGLEVPAGSERADTLALLAAREALARAELDIAGGRLGLVLGSTAAGMFETEAELLRATATGHAAVFPRARRLVTHTLSTTEQNLARELGGMAQSTTLCSACSSGALALIVAAHWISSGRADAVLAGGVDPLCRMTFAGFNALGVLDVEACRPFDVSRRGLTLGEGAGFLLLESEERVKRRAAKPLAWFSGWAAGAEAHHVTHPEPDGARAAELIQRALRVAARSPNEVQYVNLHGTGTPANDAMEARALVRAFGDSLSRVAVSSSKGQLGHTLGAAGAIEAAICVLALTEGRVPPTRGLERAESPELAHVRGQGVSLPLEAVLSNSFGFGGMDTVLVFEAAAAPARTQTRIEHDLCVSAAVPYAALGAGDAREALDAQRSRRFDQATAAAARLGEMALANAALAPGGVGVVLGGAYGPVERSLTFLDRILTRGLKYAAPAEFPHLVHSAATGNVSIYLGARGPAVAVSGLGLSGEAAFDVACSLVELGTSSAVIASAVELTDAVVGEILAHERADGASRAPGGAALIVESAASLEARGGTALARIERVERFLGAPRLDEYALSEASALAAVVFAERDEALLESVQRSPWAAAPRFFEDASGYHEALGASALAHAVALIVSGTRRALVLGADAGISFVTELSQPEAR